LNPYYVTGFVDGEGSFPVLVLKRPAYKTGWNVIPVFTISMHIRDQALLEKIQCFFGGIGKISFRKKDNVVYYSVKSVKEIMKVIIPHFEKYPLLTEKQIDFELFKKIVTMMFKKEHLTEEGLNKIINIKSALNKGLTPLLTQSFPSTILMERPPRKSTFSKVNPYWITGFVEAEGCFFINTIKSDAYKLGYQVRLELSVVQHIRDKILMANFVNFFNSGALYENTGHITYKASKLSDINKIIIPHFKEYPLQGYKFIDFEKFCSVALLMQNKEHLTREGLDKIIEIKNSK
jgi:hypothetical protein